MKRKEKAHAQLTKYWLGVYYEPQCVPDTEATALNKQTNSLISLLTVCMTSFSWEIKPRQSFPSCKGYIVACIHVYDLSFYPMTCLGFKAKFLILPKHHLRAREGEPHPQSEGSGPLALVGTAPCAKQIREVQNCDARLPDG